MPAKHYQALTTREAASLLQVQPCTIRDWIRHGKIRASRAGKSYLIEQPEVNRVFTETHPKHARHAPQVRIQLIRSMRGRFAGTGSMADDFQAAKRKEALLEAGLCEAS